MAATKSIMGGHWREAYHYLSSLSVWNLIGGAKEDVLVLLKAKLQVHLLTKLSSDRVMKCWLYEQALNPQQPGCWECSGSVLVVAVCLQETGISGIPEHVINVC